MEKKENSPVDSVNRYGFWPTMAVYIAIGFALWVGFGIAKTLFGLIALVFS